MKDGGRSIGKFLRCSFGVLLAGASLACAQQATVYKQTNIISDGAVPALVTDPNFVDPWGVSIGQAFWINTNVTGFDYVTDASGNIQFKATIPPASGTGPGSPTGTVFVSGAPAGSFMLSNGQRAVFLFCSLDGTISGWNLSSPGNVAEIKVNRSASKAAYTDIALVTNSTGTYVLAANFGQGHSVEVFDSGFNPVAFSGPFTDPNLPAGYAPYAIHTIGTTVYVTYMLRDTTTFQETLGAGTGIVDAYDVNGQFVKRAITGGNLNAPWGMALAPSGFGRFGGDLLVGNFGDGVINVYDPTSYDFLGQLTDANGNVITNSGLWEIVFGQANPSVGDPNTLYFSAGLNQERDGLFGSIAAVASNATGSFTLTSSSGALTVTRGQSVMATLNLAPANGFTGSVSLACSGLPAGTTCSFSQTSINVTGAATAQTTLTISSSTSYTPPTGYTAKSTAPPKRGRVGIAMAALTPFAALLLFGAAGRRRFLAMLPIVLLGLMVTAGVAGCGSGGSMGSGSLPTPTGTSQVTVTATSGAISKSTVIALTVQ
jgi:uncharacterized protein (TIGR03118 family)